MTPGSPAPARADDAARAACPEPDASPRHARPGAVAAAAHTGAAVVLLALEASRRGFVPERYKHPMLAWRRALRKLGVRIIERGGQEWVQPAAIDRAILGDDAPPPAEAPPPADVLALVASAKGGR